MDSQLLAEALSKSADIRVCGAYSSFQNAVAAMERERPHVVVLSSTLEDVESKGFELARAVRSIQLDVRIVMLLDSSEPGKVVEAFRSGAKGVFCRNESLTA
jgi:DNA-binding NarL/FixJ family response regulator